MDRKAWVIIGVASAVLVLLCGATAVIGFFAVRDRVAHPLLGLDTLEVKREPHDMTPPDATPDDAAGTPQVLLEDDFSDPDSGWYVWEDDQISIDYAGGVYRFVIEEQNAGIWETHRSVRFSRLRDVRIEVDVTPVDGYAEDSFGIVCRATADDRYYVLEFSIDGWAGIGKVDGDDYHPLTEDDDTFDVSLRTPLKQSDNATFRLRADCIDDTLALYINGEKVAEARDRSYRSGRIGLAAYNSDTPRTEVHFDNIVVSTP